MHIRGVSLTLISSGRTVSITARGDTGLEPKGCEIIYCSRRFTCRLSLRPVVVQSLTPRGPEWSKASISHRGLRPGGFHLAEAVLLSCSRSMCGSWEHGRRILPDEGRHLDPSMEGSGRKCKHLTLTRFSQSVFVMHPWTFLDRCGMAGGDIGWW